MQTVNVSVIGAAGYTGGELIRLLVNHPNVKIVSAVSQSQQGKKLSTIFPDLINETELTFSESSNDTADVVFLCLQHGTSEAYLKEHPQLLQKKIIDLSRDFRLKKKNKINDISFVYGLPELNKVQIKTARYIANPGCFATAVQLGLLPLAKNNLLESAIHVTALTGSTGAGIKPIDTTHFSWRQNNASVYNAFEHPHNEEILESLCQLQTGFTDDFLFIPQRGSFTRGIMATIMVDCFEDERKIKELFQEYYKNEPFTDLLDQNIDLKSVVNTNKCFITIKKHKNTLLIVTVIDNLLKGASGQAVQNMNIMFDLPEQAGLKLKSITF